MLSTVIAVLLINVQVNSRSSNDDGVNDINVEPVWMQGINGSSIVVAIVDNGRTIAIFATHALINTSKIGVEIYHDDLAQNFVRQ